MTVPAEGSVVCTMDAQIDNPGADPAAVACDVSLSSVPDARRAAISDEASVTTPRSGDETDGGGVVMNTGPLVGVEVEDSAASEVPADGRTDVPAESPTESPAHADPVAQVIVTTIASRPRMLSDCPSTHGLSSTPIGSYSGNRSRGNRVIPVIEGQPVSAGRPSRRRV